MQKSITEKGFCAVSVSHGRVVKIYTYEIKKRILFPPKHGDVVKRLACMFAPDTGLHPAEMNFKKKTFFLLLCCNSE